MTQMQARHAMEKDMRKALAAGEFELYYQPMVKLDSGEISGFEALLRWHHPTHGLVTPDKFMPLADETGFIVAIGEWTIREACATAAKWPGSCGLPSTSRRCSSGAPALPLVVAGALAESGLAPDRLELEINEMALWGNVEAALSILYQLRGLGVRIAMDDFGTGYSSLNYLQSFPFDKIKIDRSFVQDITDGVGSLKIVRAVSALAQGFGMETTVEGVESLEQLAAVKAEGCNEMQGYLFSRPLPAERDRAPVSRQAQGCTDRQPGGCVIHRPDSVWTTPGSMYRPGLLTDGELGWSCHRGRRRMVRRRGRSPVRSAHRTQEARARSATPRRSTAPICIACSAGISCCSTYCRSSARWRRWAFSSCIRSGGWISRCLPACGC